MTKTLANGYSYESSQQELSNEYQDDKVWMVFKDLCVLVLWTEIASGLEGLRYTSAPIHIFFNDVCYALPFCNLGFFELRKRSAFQPLESDIHCHMIHMFTSSTCLLCNIKLCGHLDIKLLYHLRTPGQCY